MNLLEAFRALDALNEDTFSVSQDGIAKLADFQQTDDLVDEVKVIDPDAENEDDLQDSYVGKVILDCCVCHSKLYKDKDEVTLNDEGTLANVDEECPFCYTVDGFKVVGEVTAFSDESSEDEDTDEEESTAKLTESRLLESPVATLERPMSSIGGTLSSVMTSHKDELASVYDKPSAISFLDSIEPEVRNKGYLSTVRDKIRKLPSSRVSQFLYNIILKGDGMGAQLECKSTDLDELLDVGVSLDASGSSVGFLKGTAGKVMNSSLEKEQIDELLDANISLDASGSSVGFLGGSGGSVINSSLSKPVEEGIFGIGKKKDNKKGSGTFKVVDGKHKNTIKGGFKTKDDAYDWIENNKEPDEYSKYSVLAESNYVKEGAFNGGQAEGGFRDTGKRAGGAKKTWDDALDGKATKSVKAKELKPGMTTSTGKVTKVSNLGWVNGRESVEVSYGGTGAQGSHASDVVPADKEYKVLDESKSIKEAVNNVNVETDDSVVNVSTDENGKVTVTTEPNSTSDEAEEVISPVSDETQQQIEGNTSEESVEADMEEFDEESFDELGESYLKRVYENVASYKTTSVSANSTKMVVEGVIRFTSGNQKKTSFIFESKDCTRSGKFRLIGENAQLTKGNKSFTLSGRIAGKKFITESLDYNYRSKDDQGRSAHICGTCRK